MDEQKLYGDGIEEAFTFSSFSKRAETPLDK